MVGILTQDWEGKMPCEQTKAIQELIDKANTQATDLIMDFTKKLHEARDMAEAILSLPNLAPTAGIDSAARTLVKTLNSEIATIEKTMSKNTAVAA
jgi:hypothetical protein